MNIINNYKNELTELELKKEILLNNIKTSYINKNINNDGNDINNYEKDKKEIEKLSNEFFILENELLNRINPLKKELEKNNNLVNNSKKILQENQLNYLKEKSSNDASVPRYYELLELTRSKKIELLIKIIVILGFSYLIYKKIKK
jgi:hypothetical protein